MEIARVIISEVAEQQLIVLRESEGERIFSYMSGIFEATAIDRILKHLPSPRPLIHDAWLSTIVALGAQVQAVCITSLSDAVYFAELRLHCPAGVIWVDMRPSDAIAMALKANAPIFIPEGLLAKVCSPT
jgi:bifunctional DNase/RNase